MNNQIEEADFVLVVCTETYELRFRGKGEAKKGFGVKWEGLIITQELYDKETENTTFIPVIFSLDDSASIPIVLRSATHYLANTENGYKDLYRSLTNQPYISKPELGKISAMAPRERKQDIVNAPWNIPYQRNAYFTGREDVLEQLHDTLISNKAAALAQPLAISGLGGIGKTQTAVEYAYRYHNDYKNVLWVKADTDDSIISDYVAIAELLDLPEKNEAEQNLVVASVKRWLGRKDNTGWLLIFDNADDPELIENYLPLNPKGHILLTSRAQTFDNLGIANPVELEKMPPDEARLFFIKRTRHENPEPEEIKTIDKLAQELGYLPLAMEQAGAYINKIKCSYQDYLTSYHERGLLLLQKAKVTASKYPDSVATTWLLNFEEVEKLSKASADLLFASAFLAHDKIPLEIISDGASELGDEISSALADVDNDPVILAELLEPLTQYSLIRRDSSSRTYSIHRLVQAVLRDRMDAPTQHLWGERVVKAVNYAYPEVEFSKWHICDRLLPHALVCAKHIETWDIELEESAALLNQTGDYLHVRARYWEAEPLLKRALEIRENALESEHPDVANSLNNLALLYLDQGIYQEAEPLLKRALKIREKVLESEHPDMANSLNNLAGLYHEQGKYQEAKQLYKRALNISEKVLEPEHPDMATNLNNLASLYHDQMKYQESEQLYKRALEIREKVLEPDHPNVATSLNNLALLYHGQGKYQEAEQLYKRAQDIREMGLKPDHPNVANSLNNLAALYQDQGKYHEAKPLYVQTIKILEKTLGADHPHLATPLENYAGLLRKMKRDREAAQMEKRAKRIRAKLNPKKDKKKRRKS